VLNKLFNKYNEQMYVILRVIVGLMFALHGASKIGLIGDGAVAGFAGAFGFPIWLAWFVALIELVGGIFILLGFFTRLSAALGSIIIIITLIITHFPKKLNPLTNKKKLTLIYLIIFLLILSNKTKKLNLKKTILNKKIF